MTRLDMLETQREARRILRVLPLAEIKALWWVFVEGQLAVSAGQQTNPHPPGSKYWAAWIIGYEGEQERQS
jgi:hypothetical protein